MIIVELTSEPIDVSALTEQVKSPQAGGVVVFEGTTRAGGHHGVVAALEYEAYERRARLQLEAIANEAVQKWQLESAAVVHRTGVVEVGQPGVAVVAVSAHRAEAFDACRWMIDTVKSEAAIWKRELYSDGTSTWIGCD